MPPHNLPTEHVEEPVLPRMVVANPQPPEEEPIPSTSDVAKKVASLALLGVLLVVAMALTVIVVPRGVRYLSSVSFSSLFVHEEKVVVTPQKSQVVSGERVTITWNGPTHTQGVYSLTYPCKQDISATFHSGELIACNTPFYFASNDNSASLSFTTMRDRNTDIPLYVNYKDNDGNVFVIGDTLITVLAVGSNTTAVATTTTTVVTTPIVTKPVVTKPAPVKPKPAVTVTTNSTSGLYADLAVRVVDFGSINTSNIFIPGLPVPTGNRPAVRFEVSNVGTKSSGIWSFKAILPSPTTPVYTSNFQPSLNRGDRVIMTLGFDVSTSGGLVTISINDNRAAVESNYQNNIITYTTSGSNASSVPTTSTGTARDLSARIIATGYIANGQFFAAQSVSTSQRPAIKFAVTNIGQAPSGAWTFKADLPSRTDTTYTSATLGSLNTGASAEFTVSFDNISRTGDNTFTITLNPGNSVSGTIRAY